ncbi:ribosome recycling factor domain-containing protein [Amylocystis lapponica]|nr:ribosome recycling factor domain-containing protein [Amylocystis lapponica]
MSLVALVARSSVRLHTSPRPWRTSLAILLPVRFASRKHNRDKDNGRDTKEKHSPSVSTSDLVPGSQRIAAGDEHKRAEEKMRAVLERFRKDVAGLEMRASGRVTPAVLAPVRVPLPDNKGADGRGVLLEEIATVGVREGTTLLITVFEEHTLKHVEQAIYDAKIPHVVPQKIDSRTIKIPMPKPTVEARQAMVANVQRQAEEARMHVRKQHQASLKKGKYAKHSVEVEEFQSLTDKYLGAIDKVLAESKKSAGSK